MTHTRILPLAALLITFIMLSINCIDTAASSVPDPTEQMRPVVEKIVEILTDPELQGDEHCTKRRKKVMAVVQERFDFEEMSKRVLGRQWRKLSASQKETFTGLFTTLLEHAYIGKVEDYSRQKVEFRGQRIKKDRAQVETVLIDRNVSIPVSYIMMLRKNEWMAYDIIVEGVSLVRNYMEQFREIIRKKGYNSLVAQMRSRIKELEASAGKSCPTEITVRDDKSES